jgi:DNA ligase-1
MKFLELAQVLERVASTTKRLQKIQYLSEFLKSLQEEEIPPAVLLITGQVFPESSDKTLDVSWKTIQKALQSNQATLLTKELSINDVYSYFQQISRVSQRKKKERIISSLLNQAAEQEKTYILKNFFGEMRIGASEGILLEAVAKAAGLPKEDVKRSHALIGDLGETAVRALVHKELPSHVTLFRPIKPMLAQMGDLQDITERTALEYKLDGARIQIHRGRDQIKIFSRRLTDVTESLPDIVELVQDFPESVTEGEVVAENRGRPLPFQELLRRFRRVHDIRIVLKEVPLQLYLFDVLYVNGNTLLTLDYVQRTGLLSEFAEHLMVKRIVTDDTGEALQFLDEAVTAGHEGLMVKKLDSIYIPGKRDKSWLKVKPVETLDLIITAAEWGHGRRKGWLSNYHLATQEGQVIGKTFKGLTDKQFHEMTDRLLTLKIDEDLYTVYVTPDVVVEVAFNEIQKSPTYASGYALRFARIKRVRYDKSPEDADTLGKVQELYEKQFEYKAKREM